MNRTPDISTEETNKHLQYYPPNACEEVHTGIRMKAYDFMYERNRNHMRDTAMAYFGQKISYGEMFRTIDRYAAALRSHGVREGDTVSIVLPNVPECIYLFYGLNRIGAVANQIDPRTNAEAILERVNAADSKLLFVIGDIVDEKIMPVAGRLKTGCIVAVSVSDSVQFRKLPTVGALFVKTVYGTKRRSWRKSSRCLFVKEFLRGGKSEKTEDSPYRPDLPVSIMYTSGTTGGAAKGAVFSNEAYNAVHKQMMVGRSGYKRGNTFLSGIPFFSAFGSMNGMHNALCNGWAMQIVPKFHPNDFDLLIKRCRPNSSLAVPRFWETLVENGRLGKMDMSFLIFPTAGGDKMPSDTVDRINRFLMKRGSKVRLVVGYGTTEVGGAVSVTMENDAVYAPGSVGTFLPGCAAKIIDPDTGEEQTGESRTGELCLYSPTMMLGYFQNTEATDEITLTDGNGRKYYRTGDKVCIDEKGVNWILDRYKRVMMRPDGHTVGASPIEDVIMSHPSVRDCTVAGVPLDDKGGVIPTAFLALKDGENMSGREMIDSVDEWCRHRLPERDKALAYEIVPEIPYTLMGKADYRKLEKRGFSRDTVFVDDPLFGG